MLMSVHWRLKYNKTSKIQDTGEEIQLDYEHQEPARMTLIGGNQWTTAFTQ